MQVTLLGTGDTTGTPTPGCDCGTCTKARTESIHRSRFSVHIQPANSDEALLIDASPDFRYQFLTQDVSLPTAIVITHIHFDHLDGLGNAYRLLDDIPVYAADKVDPVTNESVAETIDHKYDYLDTITVVPQTPTEPFEVCDLEVTLYPVTHPPLLCYGVVVKDPETDGRLAITGDTNYAIPQESLDAFANADVLFVDGIVPASYADYHPFGGEHFTADGVPRTFGRKHMTIEGARTLANELSPDRYRIVHLSHYIPVEDAFDHDMAIDGEQFTL